MGQKISGISPPQDSLLYWNSHCVNYSKTSLTRHLCNPFPCVIRCFSFIWHIMFYTVSIPTQSFSTSQCWIIQDLLFLFVSEWFVVCVTGSGRYGGQYHHRTRQEVQLGLPHLTLSVHPRQRAGERWVVRRASIWLKSDLYFRLHIEDLIASHYWSCSSELCMNFVFVYCVIISTNQKAYF